MLHEAGSARLLIAFTLAFTLPGLLLAQTPKQPYYLPAGTMNFAATVPSSPGHNSPEQQADLAAVHAAERDRTPQTVAQARLTTSRKISSFTPVC